MITRRLFLWAALFTVIIACTKINTLQKSESSKKDLDMIALNALTSQKYTLKVGQRAFFKTKVHGSVGLWAEHEIGDESILKLVSNESEFENKARAKMPGGDAAQMTFIFEALQAGKSEVIIKENFRGTLKDIASFRIEVE